jgi:hypothetical protein
MRDAVKRVRMPNAASTSQVPCSLAATVRWEEVRILSACCVVGLTGGTVLPLPACRASMVRTQHTARSRHCRPCRSSWAALSPDSL